MMASWSTVGACLLLALAVAVMAAPAFPKKYDPLIHGGKRPSTYKQYKTKYEYKLKAPEDNSYDNFAGTPEDPMRPPEEYPYLRADGVAHGDLSPPPKVLETTTDPSSYLVYNSEGELDAMLPPPVSSYAIIPATNDGADAMSFLRFMVRALPQDSSYSKYLADPDPEALAPPKELPESSYLAYPKDAKSDKIELPESEPRTEKSTSSYSSYDQTEQ